MYLILANKCAAMMDQFDSFETAIHCRELKLHFFSNEAMTSANVCFICGYICMGYINIYVYIQTDRITLEAKKNSIKHTSVKSFILNLIMTQKHFFWFYTSKLHIFWLVFLMFWEIREIESQINANRQKMLLILLLLRMR